MFKKVLVPISSDGLTKLQVKKIEQFLGDGFGKLILAFISDPLPPYIYAEYGDVLAISDADHKKACKSFADKLFSKAGLKFSGVPYETCHLYDINVAEGIIRAATKTKADLIVMSSHRRAGLAGEFLGSDTHRVIVGCKLPVLVV